MKDYVVPQEDEDDEKDFCCVEKKEFKYKANKYDNLDWDTCSGLNIKRLIQMLSNHSVGADLQIFTPDFSDLKPGEIYYGPQTEVSTLVNLHVVIIVAVIRYKGKLVAKCKSSYGTKCNDAGYIYVSLTTMLYVSNDRNPSSLFTRLVVLK
ncbi:unnamed protein product [Arabis nemorensis]|uniref:Peptidase C1A papain C-terminal domain-containing protein n=1 Tax=Arabis nemorensis TaxID=586526 RepID=A0A565CSN1_9BRAS|nr:unnamed protein product [Arabis nemorensis]